MGRWDSTNPSIPQLLSAKPGLGRWALVWVIFHLFVIGYEEPTLRKSFASEYEAYRASVPRWIPRLSPWGGDVKREL